MNPFQTMDEAVSFVYRSLLKAKPYQAFEDDAVTRAPYLTEELLTRLDLIPEKNKILLVTGSKGKGSTSRMIASILQNHGLKVGLFTSPHLVHYNERIRVNGKAITDERFLQYINENRLEIEKVEKMIKQPLHYLGPTGIFLSIALKHFREEETDMNVIEIGRGGMFDDTNVLPNKWAVITRIMEEHLGFLGKTIEDIAEHKLGIIKDCTESAIIGKQTDSVIPLVKKQANRTLFYGEHFHSTLNGMTIEGSEFSVTTFGGNEFSNLALPLLGSYQTENASLAIQACEVVLGNLLDESIVSSTLKKLRWPGRLEVVARDPVVILDGSINKDSAMYLKEILPFVDARMVVCIIAVPANKDYKGVIGTCSEFAHHLIVTTPDKTVKQFPDDAFAVASSYHGSVQKAEKMTDAIKIAKNLSPSVIFIVGTQSLIGSAKEVWKDELLNL
ncbi:bifunctional folylpolyglutamate synthase/dihydrofolate synthase [Bacillus sp. FJAT-45066]|uniref:bifunctional folylpolyglutamate synthase/dihydrofolate synthase n=1 Tax=Bacillus sp. FJAT-45066 TaxID=2011010 RepID=UPI000BB94C09|nr:Mur ligase family protein [Bacillus sp. FJAT-45066]